MALQDRNYDPAQMAGAVVRGANLSPQNYYGEIAINVSGTTAQNVFGQSTAPTSGTITSFGLGSLGVAGTVTLFATTAGTIATLAGSGTAGTYVGNSTAINAAIVAGDTVTVTPTAGSQTCFITFQTVV